MDGELRNILWHVGAFAASVAESGALKSVQNAIDTGAGQVLNVGSAALTVLKGGTDAQKAAA